MSTRSREDRFIFARVHFVASLLGAALAGGVWSLMRVARLPYLAVAIGFGVVALCLANVARVSAYSGKGRFAFDAAVVSGTRISALLGFGLVVVIEVLERRWGQPFGLPQSVILLCAAVFAVMLLAAASAARESSAVVPPRDAPAVARAWYEKLRQWLHSLVVRDIVLVSLWGVVRRLLPVLSPANLHPFARFCWISGAALLGVGMTAAATAVLVHCCSTATHTPCATSSSWCCNYEREFKWLAGKETPWVLVSGLAAAPALLLTWWWRTIHKDTDIKQKQHEIETARHAERSERFREATRMLGEASVELQLGAIYSMDSLASDSPEECQHVIATLCAFVRKKGSPVPPGADKDWRQPPEIQEALRVISRNRKAKEPIDLRAAQLPRIELNDLNLEGADLRRADLSECTLRGVKLPGAKLDGVNLERATLFLVDLHGVRAEGGSFRNATLSGVVFIGARLIGANLMNLTLYDVRFDGADLSGADLSHEDPKDPQLLRINFKGATMDPSTRLPGSWGRTVVK